jgi:soluble lytic murein transglycosylase-like protein
MSIDPRVLSTLLKLQFMPELDPNGSGTLQDTSADGTSLFGTLLQQLLASSGSTDGALASVTDSTGAAMLAPLAAQGQLMQPIAADQGNAPNGSETGYEAYIRNASSKYNVDPTLVRAVIDTESSFNANAVSPAGAKGLMQLMDGTARGLGVTDPFDPQQNIDAGTRYLSYLIGKYDGSVQTALAAYNAGPGRVDRAGIRSGADLDGKLESLPRETQQYIAKVMNALNKYGASVS